MLETHTLSMLLTKLRSMEGAFEESGFILGIRDLRPTRLIQHLRK